MRARFEEWISSAGRLVTPVLGVVTGSGQVAQSAVEAGADFLLVLNSGLYRSQGAGSLASFLPYGNSFHLKIISIGFSFFFTTLII